MKFSACLLALMLVCAPGLRGDDVAKTAKVEELLTLTRMEQTYGQMMSLVMNQMNQATLQKLTGRQVPAELQAELDEFQKELGELVLSEMGWAKMKPDYVRLYAEAYTEEELDGILAFHRSPAGQAMITKMPSLLEKSSAVAQQRVIEISPKVQQLVAEWTEKISAREKKQ